MEKLERYCKMKKIQDTSEGKGTNSFQSEVNENDKTAKFKRTALEILSRHFQKPDIS